MMDSGIPPLWTAVLLGAVIVLAVRLVRAPRRAAAMVVSGALGVGALLMMARFGADVGIPVPLNGWTLTASAVLGLPGAAVLAAIRLL